MMDAITITTATATTGPHTIALQPAVVSDVAPTAVVGDIQSAYQTKLMHKI